MTRLTKVEKSPNYAWIVDKLGDGWSTRRISKVLQEEFGETIGHNAIAHFKKNKFNKLIIQSADSHKERLHKSKQLDSVDDVVSVEDTLSQVSRQYVNLLDLNDEAITYFKSFLKDSRIDGVVRASYAFKVMDLAFRHSLGNYFKLDINKSDDSYFMELVRDSERFNKLAAECDEYYNTVDNEFNEI